MSAPARAAESAKWHRDLAAHWRDVAAAAATKWHDQDGNEVTFPDPAAPLAAHHEAAAEALELLVEIARTYPKTLAMTLTDDHLARLLALVEGK